MRVRIPYPDLLEIYMLQDFLILVLGPDIFSFVGAIIGVVILVSILTASINSTK